MKLSIKSKKCSKILNWELDFFQKLTIRNGTADFNKYIEEKELLDKKIQKEIKRISLWD